MRKLLSVALVFVLMALPLSAGAYSQGQRWAAEMERQKAIQQETNPNYTEGVGCC
ncbi:MAG: hypothetical protein ACOX21_06480 [Bacillota bacterium]